jgi:iron complex outermembrane receptor protein
MKRRHMKKSLPTKWILPSFLFIISFVGASGQRDSMVLDQLSLKDLLNVKIVSVSKSTEFLFDAPLSASVLSKEEIQRAGCTSIMEAMRLVPGVIVREQANGIYDIHLRGMDNQPPNAAFDEASNTTTLVMIDNRPIYNYLMGGTFWENLPVDINDVKKIEVIRGPAAALYGPNAVSGVINIITRQLEKPGLYLVANNQQGTNQTYINNASVGYRFNDKWSLVGSGNYQHRNRSQDSYFEYTRNEWLDNPPYFISFNNDTITNVHQQYPHPSLAMEKYAGNVFVSYHPSRDVNIDLSAGAQHSLVQKVSTENDITPLSTSASDTRYLDLRAVAKDFSAQISYNEGTQQTELEPGNEYDFHTLKASVEYAYVNGNFSLKPGFNFQNATYDDTKYAIGANQASIFNGKSIINSESASLHGEYKLLENKLRLVAGIASITSNYPDTTYLAKEFAATYKLDRKNLFRAVFSEAPRSASIFDTYVDQSITYYPSGFNNFTQIELSGNNHLLLLTSKMVELGYRSNISPHMNVDLEVFDTHSKNYSIPIQNRPYTTIEEADTIHVTSIMFTNLPMTLEEQGVTLSLTYNSNSLQIRPFITVQGTQIKNYAPYINTPDAGTAGAEQHNIYSGAGTKSALNSTPTTFGGAYINYVLTPKINLNLNAYYYSSQTYYHLTNILFNDGVRGIDQINSKLILNAKFSYEPIKGLLLFVSGKNLLNEQSREFFRTDSVPFRLLAGINFEL